MKMNNWLVLAGPWPWSDHQLETDSAPLAEVQDEGRLTLGRNNVGLPRGRQPRCGGWVCQKQENDLSVSFVELQARQRFAPRRV